MKYPPILMEDYFDPGIKTKPAIHIGSQTIDLFRNVPEEQAWEGYYLAGSSPNDLAIVRNFDPEYLKYWTQLIGNHHIINISKSDAGAFLTQVVLDNTEILNEIKNNMALDSRLHVFLPTELEQDLADKLGIPLHGTPHIGVLYGTKSGIRKLAAENQIKMPEGYICTQIAKIEKAIEKLSKKYEEIVLKHDKSVSGYFSKKIKSKEKIDLENLVNEISGGSFDPQKDTIVVEGWIKSKASLCAHIEILKNKEPIICSAWQQIMDTDGISYMGAGPLMLSPKALRSFISGVKKLANALKNSGAIGSFGPDFLITSEKEGNHDEDTCLMIELNARIPMTAIPLEIILQIKGKVGEGFLTQHISLSSEKTFTEIATTLSKNELLITEKSPNAKGVVPYNTGMLAWKKFDVVAMADSFNEAKTIMEKVKKLFSA